ncbi:hypothetical protein [Chryseobacterium sp. CFS15]|uniref:hypothetical protein n=1 Tax=Chryseobacterium sp. CFS15 TaxID=2986946 RepID=UPI0028072CF1|nr:hypothetical protein [Chryseobacterium sp. CFS15]MDQ8141930.1 hypothetical protein [Chryseobacterium sp. CFS15]
MKLFLQFILLFSFHFIFAQNTEHKPESSLKQDSVNVQNKVAEIMMVNVDKDKSQSQTSDSEVKTKNLTTPKASSDTKSTKEKSAIVQNINIVQEINTVLNYKINRIWREDLYCLVCQKNYSSRHIA